MISDRIWARVVRPVELALVAAACVALYQRGPTSRGLAYVVAGIVACGVAVDAVRWWMRRRA
jgi:hypothetical protein